MEKVNRKGQMFLIGGILVLIAIIMIKNLFVVYQTIETKRSEETIIVDRNLENILREYEYTLGLSSLSDDPNQTIYTNLNNFNDYIEDDFNTQIFIAYSFYNKSSENCTFTVMNELGEDINISINDQSSFVLDNNDLHSEIIQMSSDSNITIDYTFNEYTRNETILIDVSSNITKGFFDIAIKSNNNLFRTKSIYNRTW